MKQLSNIIVFMLLFMATVYADSRGFREIKLDRTKNSITSQKRPRSISVVPVSAFFNGTDNGVYISFTEDIGDVSIYMWNESTGEMSSEVMDSTEGNTVLYTSGTDGRYIIQVETETGDVFEGELILE